MHRYFSYVLERNALSHLLNPKWLGRGKILPITDPVETGVGLVAQRIRARGYEPRCRGFESLLAHNRLQREGPFPVGPLGRIDDYIFDALLVHLRILNWLVVNSLRTMEQKIIPDLHREHNENLIQRDRKNTGKGLPTYLLLTVKASPFILN
ncbi:hypothetical protein Cgig2_032234 [Carnegiea gigantea]|uniref:Uncharacterized protein n=1 Tax=Carnegiea gigantea TaxID=171969 RepID=A0A9Q1JJJ2_9CARY|nr:hypothetical protein Cgig2_032234 [Carnegiea gigantea]